MSNKKQLFQKYDLVRIAKDLGPYMQHFTGDCNAIVMGSYNDQFGGGDVDSYTLYLEGQGTVSWYETHQLTLIEPQRRDILKAWQKEEQDESAQKSDLDWIFANGQEVIDKMHGSSISALARCFGRTNLWGSRGEGYVYAQNARIVVNLAKPFLITGNKEGWLKRCKLLVEAYAREKIQAADKALDANQKDTQ